MHVITSKSFHFIETIEAKTKFQTQYSPTYHTQHYYHALYFIQKNQSFSDLTMTPSHQNHEIQEGRWWRAGRPVYYNFHRISWEILGNSSQLISNCNSKVNGEICKAEGKVQSPFQIDWLRVGSSLLLERGSPKSVIAIA